MSKQAVVGILAHVDAGKTTLAEAMLFNAGRIRKRGRVDDGDSHLDTNTIERERGITIFSSQAVLDHGDTHVMLVDAPGHVDFSAEADNSGSVFPRAAWMPTSCWRAPPFRRTLLRWTKRRSRSFLKRVSFLSQRCRAWLPSASSFPALPARRSRTKALTSYWMVYAR